MYLSGWILVDLDVVHEAYLDQLGLLVCARCGQTERAPLRPVTRRECTSSHTRAC